MAVKQAFSEVGLFNMYVVYLIQSLSDPKQKYIGSTSDLDQRLKDHNVGCSVHTYKFKPWRLVVSVALDSKVKAENFEYYLKQGSGHAFAKRHLW